VQWEYHLTDRHYHCVSLLIIIIIITITITIIIIINFSSL